MLIFSQWCVILVRNIFINRLSAQSKISISSNEIYTAGVIKSFSPSLAYRMKTTWLMHVHFFDAYSPPNLLLYTVYIGGQ